MKGTSVFALDIGTRKIAGLILDKTPTGYVIQQSMITEQLPGAMQDGQIHDIEQVARVISEIKQELEKQTGQTLTSAAVAAAGRSLLTCRGHVRYRIPVNTKVTSERVKSMELEAVGQALSNITTPKKQLSVAESYLCVGYSVTHYYLDDQIINALVGHQGNSVSIEVIATFLPRIVVDSLSTSLEMAGLEMASLTLEPIAAMHIVVPQTMRLLNIALIDIGAGTSDIAISSQGTIKAYGMVPLAGDEITQGIAEHLLLDFMVAERIKRNLTLGESLDCEDAFGNRLELTASELREVVHPLALNLADRISEEVLRLNEETPKGIILIGGGSLTPELNTLLAEKLGIPPHLVKTRERSSISSITGDEQFTGPQVITPLGIGCTHIDNLAMALQKVTINHRKLQFLKLPNSTIGDALVHAGFTMRNLLGKPGEAITIKLNGKAMTLPGSMGSPATIYHNGEMASVNSTLAGNDEIVVEEPADGAHAQATLGDIVEVSASQRRVTLNSQPYTVETKVLVNGQPRSPSYILQDGDSIAVQEVGTLKQLLDHLKIPQSVEISFILNGELRQAKRSTEMLINGESTSLETDIQRGMNIQIVTPLVSLKDIIPSTHLPKGISVTVNGQPLALAPKPKGQPLVNGSPQTLDYIVQNGDRVEYDLVYDQNFILTDIFQVYDLETLPRDKGVRISVNGQTTGYTHKLAHGDVIELIPA